MGVIDVFHFMYIAILYCYIMYVFLSFDQCFEHENSCFPHPLIAAASIIALNDRQTTLLNFFMFLYLPYDYVFVILQKNPSDIVKTFFTITEGAHLSQPTVGDS